MKHIRRKQARPAELLAAALDEFIDKGYAGARVEGVAVRAGVSKSTLFVYFANKEALFQAVVHDSLVGVHTQSPQGVPAFEGTSADTLTQFMLEWWRRYGTTKSAGLCKLLMTEAAHFPELARFFYTNVMAPAHVRLEALLQHGVARGEFVVPSIPLAIHAILSPLLHGVLWSQTMGAITPPEHAIDPETLIRHQAQLLVRGFSESK